MVDAIIEEIKMRGSDVEEKLLETIYLGGGTPSLLTEEELLRLFTAVQDWFEVDKHAEITLEANPDDLDHSTLQYLKDSPVNRLSIGVQSFQPGELTLMNRAHDVEQARACLKKANEYGFDVSVDLIFGFPNAAAGSWMANVNEALSFHPSHLSCYGLTVEPRTALAHQVRKGDLVMPSEDEFVQNYHDLIDATSQVGYDHYEISNFALPGYMARHNTNYWLGKPYLGVGPSAHSFDGLVRSWNVANNQKYISSLREGALIREKEVLTTDQQYNEYVMIGLRTKWGCEKKRIKSFGKKYFEYFMLGIAQPLAAGLLMETEHNFILTKKGKAFADRVASDLFIV